MYHVLGLFLLLVFALPGCATGGAVSQSDGATSKKNKSTVRRQKKKDKYEPLSRKGKRWGGWRYRGKSDDCFYRHGRRCYKTEKKACAAAKCSRKNKECLLTSGAPRVAYCEGDDPKTLERELSGKRKQRRRRSRDRDEEEDEDEDEEEDEEEDEDEDEEEDE